MLTINKKPTKTQFVHHFMAWGNVNYLSDERSACFAENYGDSYERDFKGAERLVKIYFEQLIKNASAIRSISIDELSACIQAFNGNVDGIDLGASLMCFSRVIDELGIKSDESFSNNLPDIYSIYMGNSIDNMLIDVSTGFLSKAFWFFQDVHGSSEEIVDGLIERIAAILAEPN